MTTVQTKCGTVALLGVPNAGKSTLTNALVGTKVSIVTHKVQTTRTRITGIAMYENTQIVIIDTPGIFRPEKRLDRAMVSCAWAGADEADVICVLVDSTMPEKRDTQIILDTLKHQEKKAVLVLNKVDLVDKESLLKITQDFWETGIFTDVFMLSARSGSGVESFKKWLAKNMQDGEYMFDSQDISTIPNRLLSAEITREKVFLHIHDELPYTLTVETETWEDFRNGDIKITQIIFVMRENHRSIILGKNGEKIKHIGKLAREELQDMFDTKVHLFLQVKVKQNWQNDVERYQGMGLDFTP